MTRSTAITAAPAALSAALTAAASRLKRESAGAVAQTDLKHDPATQTPEVAPELPPVESLTFDSDFKAFMHSKVEQSVKRAALKKLFSDPRFNVMDGLDTYIDDYTKEAPISDELLAQLSHARRTLFGPPKEEEKEEEKEGENVEQAHET